LWSIIVEISILLPSIGRINQLVRLLARMLPEIEKNDAEIILALNEEDASNLSIQCDTVIQIMTNTMGYWRCLNELLCNISDDKLFMWTADDIEPHENWLSLSLASYHEKYPDGLGIVALNDLFVRDQTCGHAISTKKFLRVIFGEPRFPEQFEHLYLDTLIANRAKDLGRFYFCEDAIAEHMNYITGKVKQDETSMRNQLRSRIGIGDKARKDLLDQEWMNGGLEEARMRLEER
jgi:hypothetical protein